ncbi:hypothetical protein ACJIZ3_006092 [Penstemon smallii]|uniref:Myb/SANT-like domain-containing protein n=1 Tax=Penstemon smallii TaxID=265156 RepID=A0ABD3S6U0_9LAMI
MSLPNGEWSLDDTNMFVEMLIEASINNEIAWGGNNRDAFIVISANLTQHTHKIYLFRQVLNKYKELHMRYYQWQQARSYTGLGFNNVENRIIASDEIWDILMQKYPWARRYRYEGERYWVELEFIFAGQQHNEPMELPDENVHLDLNAPDGQEEVPSEAAGEGNAQNGPQEVVAPAYLLQNIPLMEIDEVVDPTGFDVPGKEEEEIEHDDDGDADSDDGSCVEIIVVDDSSDDGTELIELSSSDEENI